MKKCFAILLAVLQIVGMLVMPATATESADVKVQKWNIVLSDDIGANFYLNVPADLSGGAMVNVTVADRTESTTCLHRMQRACIGFLSVWQQPR